MKTLIILVIASIAGGLVTAAIRSQLTAEDPFDAQTRLLTSYHSTPEATLARLADGMPDCSPKGLVRPAIAPELDRLVAHLVIEAIAQRVDKIDRQQGRERAQKIMQDHLGRLNGKLDEQETVAALNYIKAMNRKGTATCLISATAG